MIELTAELYAAAIPECCEYRTLAEHESIMLCWGLAKAVEEGRTMNCSGCDCNLENKKK